MKSRVAALLLAGVAGWAAAKDYKYEEADYEALRLSPESYKNKRVCYEGVYLHTATTFHNYMERSDIQHDKYLWLVIGDLSLPAMARKSDTMNEFVAGLKSRRKVKVYGKVKKFRHEPHATVLPHYYVEVDNVEDLGVAEPPADAPARGLPPTGPRRPRLFR